MSERTDAGHPSSASTILVGLIGAIALLVIVAALSAYYRDARREEWENKFVATSSRELADVRAEQSAELEGYGWVDRGAGIVSIPIDRAMEVVADELEADREEAP